MVGRRAGRYQSKETNKAPPPLTSPKLPHTTKLAWHTSQVPYPKNRGVVTPRSNLVCIDTEVVCPRGGSSLHTPKCVPFPLGKPPTKADEWQCSPTHPECMPALYRETQNIENNTIYTEGGRDGMTADWNQVKSITEGEEALMRHTETDRY